MEIVPSASLDTFPSENENFLCDLTDIAVTKKPCSLEIARAPSPRTGNIFFSNINFFVERVIFLTLDQFSLHACVCEEASLIF